MRPSFLLLCALAAFAPAASAQDNLVSNPGFEDGADGWSLCGSAEVVDAQDPATTERMVRSGRYALRLSSEGSCRFFRPAVALHEVTVPQDAPAVTLSFWYSRVGNPVGDLDPSLTGPLDVPTVDAANLAGWHLYRAVVQPSVLEAVRGETFNLTLEIFDLLFSSGSPPAEDRAGYYVDDVRLAAADETTADAGPPGLVADGTAPIVYVDAELGGVARMEVDGSGRRLVPGLPPGTTLPVWSPDGSRIAGVSSVATGPPDPVLNPALISIITAVPAEGGPPVEVYRTDGGVGNEPPDGTPPTSALDVRIRAIDWSADGAYLVLGVCTRTRFRDGTTSDELCSVRTVDVATGEEVSRTAPGFRPNVSSQSVVAFEETQSAFAGGRDNGIWTAPLADLDEPTLVLPSVMGSLGLSAYDDVWATWAPDGTRFATIRDVDGGQWVRGPSSSFYQAGQEIALHDADGSGSRALLLVDQGRNPGGLAWSPDGRFLLYTVFDDAGGADVWWLRVADGVTGRLTTNGLSAGADWRATPGAGTPTAPAPVGRPAPLVVYPSPTSGSATVALDLAAPAEVRLAVVDALGREVLVLLDGPQAAGALRVPASLGGLPAGVYVVTARVGGGVGLQSRAVVVAR